MPFDYERFRERLFPALLAGDRRQARQVAANAREQGAKAEDLVTQGYFPLLKELAALYRSDRLDARPPLRHPHHAQLARELSTPNSACKKPTSDDPHLLRICIVGRTARLDCR